MQTTLDDVFAAWYACEQDLNPETVVRSRARFHEVLDRYLKERRSGFSRAIFKMYHREQYLEWFKRTQT